MLRVLLISFLFFSSMFAEEKYYVTFVKGSVISERTKKPVKVGDALNPSDGLVFGSKDAKLSCISPGKGRFDIELGKAKPLKKGEWLAVLSTTLVASSKNYKLSTRGNPQEGYEPKAYFHTTQNPKRILLIDGEPIPVNAKYALDKDQSFTISFKKNEKIVRRKVESRENTILFTRKLLKGYNGRGSMMLHYSDNQEAEATDIAVFEPVLVQKEDLQAEINVLKAHFTGGKDEFLTEVANHIYIHYGKIEADELKRIFGL